MKKFRVLVQSADIPSIAFRILEKTCEVVVPKNIEEVYQEVKNVNGLMVYGRSIKINEEFFAKVGGPLKLQVIARAGVGCDYIDIESVKKRGIKLSNTPGVMNETVAEFALGLAIAGGHRFHEGRKRIDRDEWITSHPKWMLGQDIYASNFGIMGLGQIGWALATRVKALGPKRILYTQRNKNPKDTELGAEFVSREEVLRQCDFVVLCFPLNDQTRHLINKQSLGLMKNNAILVNIGRGDVIDQEALIEALKNKIISGAALDVMTPEPLPSNHPLLQLDNCLVTPHIASATFRTRNAVAELAAKNILAALNGEQMPTPV